MAVVSMSVSVALLLVPLCFTFADGVEAWCLAGRAWRRRLRRWWVDGRPLDAGQHGRRRVGGSGGDELHLIGRDGLRLERTDAAGEVGELLVGHAAAGCFG